MAKDKTMYLLLRCGLPQETPDGLHNGRSVWCTLDV